MDEVRIATPVGTPTAQPVQIKIESAPTEPALPYDAAEEAKETAQEPLDNNNLIPQESWQTSPLFFEIANFLGVDSHEYDSAAEKVSVITDWAIQQANSNKVEDIMRVIRGLEDKLQPTPWGERRYSNLYRVLRMESRYNAAKQALGGFTRTGKWE